MQPLRMYAGSFPCLATGNDGYKIYPVRGGAWQQESPGVCFPRPLLWSLARRRLLPNISPSTKSKMNLTTVEALDADGQSLGKFTVDLAPGEQRVALLYKWIPSTFGLAAGRVEIRSAGLLLAAEIFGNDDLSFIAAISGK
jgi:hypothetical protein